MTTAVLLTLLGKVDDRREPGVAIRREAQRGIIVPLEGVIQLQSESSRV